MLSTRDGLVMWAEEIAARSPWLVVAATLIYLGLACWRGSAA